MNNSETTSDNGVQNHSDTDQIPFCPEPPPNLDKLLLNDREVAYVLGISRSSVWRLSELGVIPQPINIGRSKRWHLEALRNAIKP